MTRLHEYQGKDILRQFGIAVPKGVAVVTPHEARLLAIGIGGPVVIKAQAWVTGRAGQNLIHFASTPDETASITQDLLGRQVGNFRVERIMVEERLKLAREFYLGVIVDDANRAPVVIFSSMGGTGIEVIAAEHPDKVARQVVDIRLGLREFEARDLVRRTGIDGELQSQLAAFIPKFYAAARAYEARTAEINPLALTAGGELVALDARFTIDDYAVYRHPDLGIEIAREFDRPPTDLEKIAWNVEKNDYRGTFYFIQMQMDFHKGERVIGFHGAGGGGSMMNMDALLAHDFKIANFVDTSGNPPASKVYRAARIILSQRGIDGYYAGGSGVASQEQFHSARGLVKAFMDEQLNVPAVLRVGGNAEDQAKAILLRANGAFPAPVEAYGRDDSPDVCVDRLQTLVASYTPAENPPPRPPFEPKEPYSFETITGGTVTYDHAVCRDCASKACVTTCVPHILSLVNDVPVLNIAPEQAKKGGCTECLACEVECHFLGNRGGRIFLPIAGLPDVGAMMSILIDPDKRVLIQGITGREGLTRARLMRGYHTQVVAGVTPGKGGTDAEGVPVFDSVRGAREAVGEIDISVLFVPAALVKNAALEAIDAGVKLLVIVPDRVPIYDVLEIDSAAKAAGAQFIGPNTLGVLSPDKGVLGMMGGQADSAKDWFFPGPVGVTSRSGGMTTSTAYYLAKAGIGASTLVHVGGDAIVGLPHAEVLKLFQTDPQTEAVVMFGEIGTSQEEAAAALIEAGEFTKPLIAYIGGKAAKSGTRFSHAGAIIEGDRGTHASKVARLREVGAHIVESFADIPRVTASIIQPRKVVPVSKPQTDEDQLHWKTAITEIKPNEIRLRGQRIDELMGKVTFSQAIYLALTGKLPSEPVGRLLDAILVSSIDHGASPPSALAARTSASTGAPINAAVAVGLLSINKHHGGAVEDCMRLIQSALDLAQADKLTPAAAADKLVEAKRAAKERLPGFGHRVHTNDPRTARLLELAAEAGVAGAAVAMVEALRESWARQSGKPLPINVDGAMAAVLLDLHIPIELGNTFFMMARVPGLVAHVYEEQTRERPMRRIHPTDHEYDGPVDS